PSYRGEWGGGRLPPGQTTPPGQNTQPRRPAPCPSRQAQRTRKRKSFLIKQIMDCIAPASFTHTHTHTPAVAAEQVPNDPCFFAPDAASCTRLVTEDQPDMTPPAWVHKRDGRLVPFEPDKISRSLFAATEALGRPDAFLA